jgi:IS1 family transposase
MRDLDCDRLEIDELWAFIGKKQRHVTNADDGSRVGDAWTFVAIDGDTKLIPSFLVGNRDAVCTNIFINDVARRMKYRVQATIDGLRTYADAIRSAFVETVVDYAQLNKTYETEPGVDTKYSPPKVTGITKTPIFGEPTIELVSTSYVERQNLTIRMGVRRYTRLTNAFSKKLENHIAATALHFAHYNFVRRHQSLRVTPCMAAELTQTMWSTGELLEAVLDGARS